MSSAPKLHGIFGSPYVRPILHAAALANIEVEFVECNLLTGDHLKPEFIKMNPFHQVPTLDDNGFYVYQSDAVVRYLLSAKDTPVYPSDRKLRTAVDVALATVISKIGVPGISICFQRFFGPRLAGVSIDAVADFDQSRLESGLKQFEENYFKDSPGVLVGKESTAADAFLYSFLIHVKSFGKFTFEKYPKIEAYLKSQSETEAVKKVYAPWEKVVEFLNTLPIKKAA